MRVATVQHEQQDVGADWDGDDAVLFDEGLDLSLEQAFSEIELLGDVAPANDEPEADDDPTVLRASALDLTSEEIDDCLGAMLE